jgi:hypothetical protein
VTTLDTGGYVLILEEDERVSLDFRLGTEDEDSRVCLGVFGYNRGVLVGLLWFEGTILGRIIDVSSDA